MLMKINSTPITETPDRLLRTYKVTDPNDLSDLIYCMAMNVENSMLTAGAVPGEDYTILDLYKLGMPFALSAFNEVGVTFRTEF